MKLPPPTPHLPVRQLVTGHFREKAGYYAYRPTGTDDWLLVFTLSGQGRFGYVGGEIIAKPNDLVLLRPGTLHDYGVEPKLQRWEMLWTHFHPRPAWLQWLNWPEEGPGLMRLNLHDRAVRRRVFNRFSDVHALASGAGRFREDFAMNALEELLLWCDQANPMSQQAKTDDRVRAAMEYVCRNLKEKLSLDEVADAAGLSVSRISHLFAEQVGVSVQQFVEQQRISRACQLLELTGKSIKEISAEVGFESPFYFTIRFKRAMRKAPREWRRGK